MPYRVRPDVVDEPPDPELAAARELHARAATVHKIVLVPSIALGLGLGIAGYLAVRELCFATLGAHQPYASALVGMLPPFALAFRVARALGDALVRRAIPKWTRELATTYRIDASVLDDHAAIAGSGGGTDARRAT